MRENYATFRNLFADWADYLPTTEAFFTRQLTLKIIVFLNCRHKMKYNCDYSTDRIVNLQKNDFAFLEYVIYCCHVYADLAVIKYTTSRGILTTRRDCKIMVIHRGNVISLPGSFRQKKQKPQLIVQGEEFFPGL